MKLTVALLTDIRHGMDSAYVRGSAVLPLLKQALFVDLGDCSNQPEVAEDGVAVAEIAAECCISQPKVHLRGNHDVTPRLEQETLLGVPLGNRCLELGGGRLIFLDTWGGSAGGALSPQTLASLPLSGQPLPGNVFLGGPYRQQTHPQGREAGGRIMVRSDGVKLAVGGHAHWHYSVTAAGIRYLTLAALVLYAEGEDEGGSYGMLTLNSDTLRLEVDRYGSRECHFQAVISREAPRA